MSRAGGIPILRVLAAPRGRTAIAVALWLAGTGLTLALLARQAADPAGQVAIDLDAYLAAARRIGEGTALYAADQTGGSFAAQGVGRYLYPPLFAQLLVPVAGLPHPVVVTAWAIAQWLAVLAATWLATGLGGAPRSLERLAWCAAATAWFLPVFDTLWKGNVSGFLALAVALLAAGGAAGGGATAAATLAKVVPVLWVPAVAAGGRRALGGMLVVAAIALPSLLLAPGAWADYARVLPNLAGGDAGQATNLAPWAIAGRAGLPEPVPGLLRALSIVAALGLSVLAAVTVRRRPGLAGSRQATVPAVAAVLLLPAAWWYHYLALLLPVAALVWPAAGTRARIGMTGAMTAIVLGVAWLPAATAGALTLLGLAWSALAGHGTTPGEDRGSDAARGDWRARRDSNSRPSGPQPDALSTELRALEWRRGRDSNPRSRLPDSTV